MSDEEPPEEEGGEPQLDAALEAINLLNDAAQPAIVGNEANAGQA